MIGLDIVEDKVSKKQAPVIAAYIREGLKARGVLVSTDGPFNSIIKMKPPLCFGVKEADKLLRHLQAVRAPPPFTQYLTPLRNQTRGKSLVAYVYVT